MSLEAATEVAAAEEALAQANWFPQTEAEKERTATQTPALFCGRVCLDALDGRLNKSSVCLEGERSEGGFRVPLDLTAPGALDYTKATLHKLKIKGLLRARHEIRNMMGEPDAVFPGRYIDPSRIRDNGADYETTMSRDTVA